MAPCEGGRGTSRGGAWTIACTDGLRLAVAHEQRDCGFM
jgi:hypothetical protein